MLTINDLKSGAFFVLDGDPYRVERHDFIKMAQSKGIMRVTVRNLKTGQVLEKTFKGQEKLEEADMKKSKANYSYKEGTNYYFMDQETYDQFFVSEEQLGEKSQYLKENLEVEVLNFNDSPINVELPKKVSFKVTLTAPGVRGDTAQGSVTKKATVETGLAVDVPLFIRQGEVIEINTETGKYVGKSTK